MHTVRNHDIEHSDLVFCTCDNGESLAHFPFSYEQFFCESVVHEVLQVLWKPFLDICKMFTIFWERGGDGLYDYKMSNSSVWDKMKLS